MPVEVELPVLAAAAPHVLLVLDLGAARLQSMSLALPADEVTGVVEVMERLARTGDALWFEGESYVAEAA
ncbi:hypothetical protein [Rhizobium bangladeshense]|uniref:hypothetical protein n=1 Tax=Rhizobium bangladeshense TaxID=1138189 RepID=UPI002180D224|nr:hypothetical protein [Rhizobium bangladeshense]